MLTEGEFTLRDEANALSKRVPGMLANPCCEQGRASNESSLEALRKVWSRILTDLNRAAVVLLPVTSTALLTFVPYISTVHFEIVFIVLHSEDLDAVRSRSTSA